MRRLVVYFTRLILIFYLLLITSCAFFNKKSVNEKYPVETAVRNDNESSYVLKDVFTIENPIFKIDVDSKLLSNPIMQESFASWINNFKTDFTKILEAKNILDRANSNRNYIIPELIVQPKAKKLTECNTYIPYLYKKCEEKYFVYIDGALILNFYKESVPVKNKVIDLAKIGVPNIVEASSVEDINKEAVALMDRLYKYLIAYLSKANDIYYIDNTENINK